MLKFDPEKVLDHARRATTKELLDRVTAYRAGMEPEALRIIEAELRDRGVTVDAIRAHESALAEWWLRDPEGVALECSFCRRPAVAEGWGWQRLWGKLPVFPRRFRYCAQHATPTSPTSSACPPRPE